MEVLGSVDVTYFLLNPYLGWVLAAFFYGYMLTQILGGWLTTYFGGKWVFGVGVFVTVLLTVITPLVARISVWLFIAVRVLEGIGEVRTCI